MTVVVTMGFGVVGLMNRVKGCQPAGGPLATVRWEGTHVRDAVGNLIARKFPIRALAVNESPHPVPIARRYMLSLASMPPDGFYIRG